MRGTVLYGPGDIRFEDRETPRVEAPTDAVIRIAATCVCGSDLWPYRGLQPIDGPTPMGHEYCGIVEEVGSSVRSVKPGQFVVGSFAASDNTCPNCRYGYQSSCVQREFMTRAQAPVLRVPLADGTLVPTPGVPSDDLVPSLLTTSDVLGTGWFAADAANVRPGSTVAVVGDGAVGLLGVLSAKQMGAERIIAMSRHETRQKLAREFGATDIVVERGDEGVGRILELTKGVGADSVLECVGTQESMMQAIRSTRRGGYVSYVGVPHEVELDGAELFFAHVHLHGGPAPVRRYLPQLIDLVLDRKIDPGKVFDLALPLDQVAESYRAMDERRAIKALSALEAGRRARTRAMPYSRRTFLELMSPVLAIPMVCRVLVRARGTTIEEARMEITRVGSQPSAKGPADWFTGTVRIDPLFPVRAPARAAGNTVTFEPGGRTAWHTHPLGQTLIVTTGCGWVQREGGPVEEVHPGDVVWFPPGEKHWHGATPTTAMTHIAIQEGLDGKMVDWLEHVRDEQYRR